jgi:hypothetical protein
VKLPALACLLLILIGFGTATATDQPLTFHSIKLGLSLDSQFQRCPTKDGEYPKFLSSPFQDRNGNTIPCFYELLPAKPKSYPDVRMIRLVEYIAFFWNEKENPAPPMPGRPDVWIDVFVPASKEVGEGTVEAVRLEYDSSEADRVKTALIEKYGTSHPPEKKIDTKIIEPLLGAKLISQEVWKTAWGELMLLVWDKYVVVDTKTQKLISFEQANKKDEF